MGVYVWVWVGGCGFGEVDGWWVGMVGGGEANPSKISARVFKRVLEEVKPFFILVGSPSQAYHAVVQMCEYDLVARDILVLTRHVLGHYDADVASVSAQQHYTARNDTRNEHLLS